MTSDAALTRISLGDIEALAFRALRAHRATPEQAAPVARSIRAAEAEGIRSVGLDWLPIYCRSLKRGGVDGAAVPQVEHPSPSAVLVDAKDGFAHTAYEAGEAELISKAHQLGIAVLGIRNSFACGVMGYYGRRLSAAGLVSISVSNSSALVAPWGGKARFLGTNPLAFGAPSGHCRALVFDGSTAATALASVRAAQNAGAELPAGWAIDCDGLPTTDPTAALNGALLPLGGAKGTGLGLMVEVLAAGLVGAKWSFEVPRIADVPEQPMRIGQLFIAIKADVFGKTGFDGRMSSLLSAYEHIDCARIPGSRGAVATELAEADGVMIKVSQLTELLALGHADAPSIQQL